VFANRAGFQTSMLAVTVAADSATEIALLLDSVSAPGGKRYAMPMAEFQSRSRWIGTNSALIARQELAGRENMGVGDALRYSLSYLRKGLVLDDAIACVYINGLPSPMTVANDIRVGDVEAIEVYGLRSDYTNTLGRRWPGKAPCGNSALERRRLPGGNSTQATGLQSSTRYSRAPMDRFVRAVVIWLKDR
jgi:hypothetical protein